MTFSWFCQGLLLPLQHHLKVVPFSNIFWGIFTLLSTHYAIQQNLYRYILEKNYGIIINNMSIVVLHPIYNDYRKYDIPRMDKEVQIIINYLRSTN